MKVRALGRGPGDPRLTAIRFVVDAVNRVLDLREVADNALHAVLAVMEFDGGAIYVCDETTHRLKLFASRGLSEAFIRQTREIAPGQESHIDAALNGEPQIVSDFRLARSPLSLDAARAGFVTGLISPIRAQGIVVGVMVLGAYRSREITGDDLELIEVISNQVGNAMVHAQLREDLRASEEHYRTLVENSGDAICVLDPDGRVQWANSSFERMLGYRPEELPADGILSTVHEADAHDVARAFARMLAGERVSGLEFRIMRKDGGWIFVQCNGSAFGRQAQGATAVQWVMRDITGAKQREQELLRTNQQLSALVEISAAPAQQLALPALLELILNRAAALLEADAGYLIRFDKNAEQSEIVAVTPELKDLLGPRGPASRGLSGLVRASGQGRIFTAEEVQQYGYSPVLRRANVRSALVVPLRARGQMIGTLTLVRMRAEASPFNDDDLRLMEVFATRAAAAIDTAELVKDLQRQNELLELLVQEAHHRIKNNLQMVSGLLQLQATSATDGTFGDQLRTATLRVQAIAKVHNLLSQDQPDRVDAEKLIAVLVHTLADLTTGGQNDAHVELDLEPVTLTSEQAVAVALIVNELVSNSLLHARVPAGQRLALRMACRRTGENVEMEFADNGGGLPAGFDWRRSPGQGWTIIKQLTEVNLQGQITVESREGGLRVRVEFPAKEVLPESIAAVT
ncbi:MAG: GAF domain-containing protein [Verrucomicrobiae bacterium]|nr:GAF domain-containing protein [Verrucomicrobiae bacterium]MDW8343834.1 GAF domain-containing protein [Verrucomicrobiae bacterium]